MSKLKLLSLVSIAALTCAPIAMAQDGRLNPYHVPGESIDAGISPALNRVVSSVPGEKLDAGFSPVASHVANGVKGEKLDSGLGEVTQEEIRRFVNAYGPQKVASSN